MLFRKVSNAVKKLEVEKKTQRRCGKKWRGAKNSILRQKKAWGRKNTNLLQEKAATWNWSPYGWTSDMPCLIVIVIPSWYSFMHGRLADNILLVVEEICAVDQMTWSQYSIGRWVCRRTQKSAIDVDLVCGVLVSSTPYSGFWVNLVQLIAWAEDTYIGSTLCLLCFEIEQFILSKWWEYTAGSSRRRVRVSWRYLMERTYQTVSFGTTRCIGIVRTMVIFEHLICLKICMMRCFGIVRTIPTSSSSCSLGRCLSSTRTTLLFF